MTVSSSTGTKLSLSNTSMQREEATVKSCWVPFQRTLHNRKLRRLRQGANAGNKYEDPPNKYYIQDSEVTLYEYDGQNGCHHVSGETELVLNGHPMPSKNDLEWDEADFKGESGCNINVFGIQDDSTFQKSLGQIDSNCMRKEFWVEDIVAHGSLTCLNHLSLGDKLKDEKKKIKDEEIYKEDIETQIPLDLDSMYFGEDLPNATHGEAGNALQRGNSLLATKNAVPKAQQNSPSSTRRERSSGGSSLTKNQLKLRGEDSLPRSHPSKIGMETKIPSPRDGHAMGEGETKHGDSSHSPSRVDHFSSFQGHQLPPGESFRGKQKDLGESSLLSAASEVDTEFEDSVIHRRKDEAHEPLPTIAALSSRNQMSPSRRRNVSPGLREKARSYRKSNATPSTRNSGSDERSHERSAFDHTADFSSMDEGSTSHVREVSVSSRDDVSIQRAPSTLQRRSTSGTRVMNFRANSSSYDLHRPPSYISDFDFESTQSPFRAISSRSNPGQRHKEDKAETSIIRSPSQSRSRPADSSPWSDDESELNTEAFRKFSEVEADDDDSIFSDLKSVDEKSM